MTPDSLPAREGRSLRRRPMSERSRSALHVVTAAIGMAAPLALTAQSVEPNRPLPITAGVGLRSMVPRVPIRLSPDSKWVTFTASDPRRQPSNGALGRDNAMITPTGVLVILASADVWVANTVTGETRNISNGQGASWGGAWSPDGRTVAFYSDRDGAVRVWLWDAETGRSRRASGAVVRTYFEFERLQWLPDGRRLLVKLLPEGTTLDRLLARSPRDAAIPREGVPSVTVFRSGVPDADSAAARSATANRGLAYAGDLALLDVESGDVRRLVRNVSTYDYWLSPAGDAVAYMRDWFDLSRAQTFYDLGVVSLADGRVRVLASEIPQSFGLSVSWSPDGTRLAYTTSLGTGLVGGSRPRGDCYVVSISGGAPRSITPGVHPSFGSLYGAPLWSADGRSLYLIGADTVWQAAADGARIRALASVPHRAVLQIVARVGEGRPWMPRGTSMYLRTKDLTTGRAGVAQVDLPTGKVEILVDEERSYPFDWLSVDAAGDAMVYWVEGAQQPPELWIASADSGFDHRRRLTRLNPALDGYLFGASRLVEWQTDDGIPVRGTLILPAGYQPGKRYPMVVKVYGGEDGSRQVFWFGYYSFGSDMRQIFATRGYAVLMPDIPLSIGSPMAGMAKAVLPGVSKIVELGIADPERVGVI